MTDIYNTFMKELAMTKQPHKHAELIKAWADGASIQYMSPGSSYWQDVNTPIMWNDCGKYRIKPEEKPWYRVALVENRAFPTETANNEAEEQSFEKHRAFVRWLTERIEYEV